MNQNKSIIRVAEVILIFYCKFFLCVRIIHYTFPKCLFSHPIPKYVLHILVFLYAFVE